MQIPLVTNLGNVGSNEQVKNGKIKNVKKKKKIKKNKNKINNK